MRHRGVVFSLALVLLLILATLAAPAGAEPPAHSRAGRWIVVLEDDVTPPGQVAADHARGDAASVRHVYDSAIRGYAASMSQVALARARRDARVAYLEPDHTATAFHHRPSHARGPGGGNGGGGEQPTDPSCTDDNLLPWGVDRVGADEHPATTIDNGTCDDGPRGATIYVLDTGATSPDLNVVETRNYAWGPRTDCNGHGTHVAGTAAAIDNGADVVGVAPGAPISALRVLDCNGQGLYSDIIAAIGHVTRRRGRRVVNMSLGGPPSTALDDAIRNAVADGVFFALAAGNDNTDACTSSPARVGSEPGVVTVGATTRLGTRAAFSNAGDCVDLWAPGVEIPSLRVNGGTTVMSGTSMASPHVAGAAAFWLSRQVGNPTPADVERALTSDQNVEDVAAGRLLNVRNY